MENSYNLKAIMKRYLSKILFVPTQFLMWERRSHAFPPHYTTACIHTYRLHAIVMSTYNINGV